MGCLSGETSSSGENLLEMFLLGRVAQLVMCLATDACLTADPGVPSSIRTGPYFRGDLS